MLTDESRRASKRVVERGERECSVVDCEHDFVYGVEVNRIVEKTYFGFFTLSNVESTNLYCPYHSEYRKQTREALKREHEYRMRQEYEQIVGSDLLPTFRMEWRTHWEEASMTGPDERRTEARFEESSWEDIREQAWETMQEITTPHPILLVDSVKEEAVVFAPGSRQVVDRYTPEDAEFSQFEQEYGETEYHKRDYYVVQTNQLTGRQSQAMHKLTDVDLIEKTAFGKLSDETPWVLDCPNCTTRYPDCARAVHRVKINGVEKLIPYHSFNPCKSLMGEINATLVDPDTFELPEEQPSETLTEPGGEQATLEESTNAFSGEQE